MSTRASPLGLRLFLEGIEVPVIAANVTVQPNMPATAAVQVIPTDMGLNFLPRTLVHLFYLDANLSDAEIESAKKANDKTAKVRTGVHGASEIDRLETNDFAYKILFTGEVIGYTYRKSPNGRQLILQCMDLSSYWDTCYQFFSDYSAAGNGLTDSTHQFVGAGSGQFDNLGGHQWVISNLINTAPKSPEYQECKGLLGGLIHLLETVGGLRYRSKAFEGYRGVNDFFTIAEMRYGLLSMLGAIAADKTSQQLYAAKAFCNWIRSGMTSMGNLVSFRDMLNHINQFIFHAIYPNPCARYVPGGETAAKRTIQVGKTTFLDAPQGPAIQADLKKVLNRMLLAITELEQAKSEDPTVRGGKAVIAQFGRYSMGFQIRAGEAYKDASLGYDRSQVARAHHSVQEIHAELLRNTGLVEVSKGSNASQVVTSLKEITSKVQSAGKKLPSYEVTTWHRANQITEALGELQAAYNDLSLLLNLDVALRRVENYKVPKASYLYNQLFLPEAFFVSPPRCNVIFPDQYFDLTYSRNFMREVTRLASTGGLGMLGEGRQGAHLFNTTYLAPAIKDVKGKLLLATMSQGARVLLPHEVHSGIIPKFEWVTGGHRWGVQAQKGPVDKIHYLQRLANFQFFLHRWSARQLTINGIFNPNIVAGLPAVIIDRSSPAPAVLERLEKLMRRRMLPTQFVAKVYGYTHSISQGGGSTSIQFVYARTHRGLDDEFLGVLTKEIPEESESSNFETNVRELALDVDPATIQEVSLEGLAAPTSIEGPSVDPAVEEAKKKARAKQRAKTAESYELRKSVVRMYVDKKLKPGITVPRLGKVKNVSTSGTAKLTGQMADAVGISYDYFETNKKKVSLSELGVAASIPTVGGSLAFGATYVIEVPEKIVVTYVQVLGSGKYERSGVAFEDAIRPSWFSEEVWSNEKITEAVYGPLLGSRAITDDNSMGQEQQDQLLKRWKDDQKLKTGYLGNTEATATQSADAVYFMPVVKGSVEETIDGLSLIYGMIKERSGDVHGFIREFTRRPIANMVDILGSQNLEFNDSGKVANPDTMIEGFHSRAFGDYNTDVQLPEKEGSSVKAGAKALHALMDGVADPASVQRPGLIGRDEKKEGIRPELDPRGRARGRVRAYIEELQLSRGLMGS